MSHRETYQVDPYTVLASIYDRVMDHVDYEEWAGYVDALLALHAPGANSILELGGGTGRFAAELSSLRSMTLTLTDGSSAMIELARTRLKRHGIDARTAVLDFTMPMGEGMPPGEEQISQDAFDAVLLLYDGFNYATSARDALRILSRAMHVLRPGGVFVFDQVTPANSTNAENVFEDEGHEGRVAYSRLSEYDGERRIHRTTFDIATPDGRYVEVHTQRIWTSGEVEAFISESGLEAVAAYDGYSLRPAGPASERIHRVVRRRER